jgi:Ni/Fe-hydrogenase subunit HybB-like protein
MYVIVWSLAAITFRKYSLNEEKMPAGSLKYWRKSTFFSGFFLVFFAVTISTSSWDWLMSIDTKWYSTMYGWYVFVSALVSGISLIMLVIQYLRSQGQLKNITDEHVHDLGKFMFAFSILWTYLWYSQYMLIWYSNNPEETIYFRARMDHYKVLFFINLILNFVSPLLILMTAGNKRKAKIVVFIAAVIILGHWIDFYQMIMPGTIGANWTIGLMEIGLPIFFIGLIINRTFTELEKAPLVPKNHPYLKESMNHHV